MARSSAHYDTYDYPSYWKGRDYEHESEVIALNAFLKDVKQVGSLADIGGGFGRLVPYYIKKTKNVFLAEPSKNLLNVARQNFKNNPKIHYECCSLDTITKNIKKGSLDVIVMVRVMHHLKDPKEVMKTLSSLLKKDGLLIVEFANKVHGKALLQNLWKGDFTFPLDITPTDRRCAENKKPQVISFYNYHPDTIFDALKESGFKIKNVRSVSNIRSRPLKNNIPFNVLMKIEEFLQEAFARVRFGPSIFILAQKKS